MCSTRRRATSRRDRSPSRGSSRRERRGAAGLAVGPGPFGLFLQPPGVPGADADRGGPKPCRSIYAAVAAKSRRSGESLLPGSAGIGRPVRSHVFSNFSASSEFTPLAMAATVGAFHRLNRFATPARGPDGPSTNPATRARAPHPAHHVEDRFLPLKQTVPPASDPSILAPTDATPGLVPAVVFDS